MNDTAHRLGGMREHRLPGHPDLPVVVSPARAGAERLPALVEWLGTWRAWLDERLHRHGAVLLRGFEVSGADDFGEVTRALASRTAEYVRGTSPRDRVKGNIYTSTRSPRFLTIPLHCEMSYTEAWPARVLFHCEVPAASGGETPLADMRRVLAELPAALRERFEAVGLRMIQNVPPRQRLYGPKGWAEMFETDDRARIEAACRAQGIDASWQPGDVLRLINHRPAVTAHPVTGERAWFNSVNTFHDSWSSELRRAGLRTFAMGSWVLEELRRRRLPPEARPRHVTYGDGAEIPVEDVDRVRDVLWRHAVIAPWARGDVVVIENLLCAHGRMPFRGARRVLTALVPR